MTNIVTQNSILWKEKLSINALNAMIVCVEQQKTMKKHLNVVIVD